MIAVSDNIGKKFLLEQSIELFQGVLGDGCWLLVAGCELCKSVDN